MMDSAPAARDGGVEKRKRAESNSPIRNVSLHRCAINLLGAAILSVAPPKTPSFGGLANGLASVVSAMNQPILANANNAAASQGATITEAISKIPGQALGLDEVRIGVSLALPLQRL